MVALLAAGGCDDRGNPPTDSGEAGRPVPEAEPQPSDGEEGEAQQPSIVVPAEPAEGGEAGTEPGPIESTERIVVGTDRCRTDADCVPATCCHPAECVAKAKAPSCGDATCTLNCQGDTMDCGGGCLCQDGKCAAKLVTHGPG
jgi:hypothetical protein